jgi:hypothetical protein
VKSGMVEDPAEFIVAVVPGWMSMLRRVAAFHHRRSRSPEDLDL